MKNNIDIKFWKEYWQSKNIVGDHRKYNFFNKIFQREIKPEYENVVEIGGYPGTHLIYLKENYDLGPTLLDYFIDRKSLSKIWEKNKIDIEDVNLINEDLFEYEPQNDYDLVISFGFLEHFKQIKEVIEKHLDFARDRGKIIIGIPNFLSLNGVFQLLFDPGNLEAHNLKSMRTENLKEILEQLDISSYKIEYYGGMLVWLEKSVGIGWISKAAILLVNSFGRMFHYLNINNKLISPYILIIIEK